MVEWIKVLTSMFCVYAVIIVHKTVKHYSNNNYIIKELTSYPPYKVKDSYLATSTADPHVVRLGNQIFKFASGVGIAQMNGLRAVITCDHYLKAIFNITLPCITGAQSIKAARQRVWSERGPGIYTQTAETLGNGKSVLVSGYLQSWRYFNHTANILKKQLQFKQHLLDMAHREIHKVIRENHLPVNQSLIKVGVHIRRTDMTTQAAQKSGYVVVDKGYIEKSMGIMRSRYKAMNMVFIICSDDMKWVKINVQGKDIVYVHTIHPHVDLAVLSLCDAVILSTGTFGWWGAWLSGGPAIYYKNFPLPNSRVGREYNTKDYYPPWWLGL